MKFTIKKMAAIVLYMLFLGFLLKTEAILLFSPKHIGMFLAGCLILCIPYLEKKTRWKEQKGIFKRNAITAGYLETIMLIFATMMQKEITWNTLPAELALDLRPIFYGFVCYIILKEEPPTFQESDPFKIEDQRRAIADETPEKEENKPELDISVLTRQEKQIAALVKKGMTNREIGEELCISEATVKKHMSNIFEKLKIQSRRDLR
ncbi:MAG: helix-turn-helix transcriptional regulator [Lachnospiraceae bacterium]|nr:helix-turn-helix transcriptional regulator [Lachnospiraceae bacterium]